MRHLSMLAAVAVSLIGNIPMAEPAAAWDPSRAPEQPLHERVINHYIYRPSYRHVYHAHPRPDPYAYRYRKVGYYPYHASRYWVHADVMRSRYRYDFHGPKFRYHPAWGASRHHAHHE